MNAAFEELKNWITSVPILAIPNKIGGMILFRNAYGRRLAYVLMQHGCVTAYASYQLEPWEELSKHDLELVEMIFTLNIWSTTYVGIIWRYGL